MGFARSVADYLVRIYDQPYNNVMYFPTSRARNTAKGTAAPTTI